jgi:hypothetical protein
MSADAPDYRQRADLHRPTDPVDIAREMRRLAAEGWTAYGIAQSLRIDPIAVCRALANPPRLIADTAP